MLEHHKTRDGRTIPIACMEDEHLERFIIFALNKCNIVFLQTNALPEKVKIMYGLDPFDEEEVAEVQRKMVQALYPYIAEAWFRGLPIVRAREMLASIMDRDGPLDLGFKPRCINDGSEAYEPINPEEEDDITF